MSATVPVPSPANQSDSIKIGLVKQNSSSLPPCTDTCFQDLHVEIDDHKSGRLGASA